MVAALDAVAWADIVVLAVGLDTTIETEALDRVNITLPGLQEPFALKVLAAGKPTVLLVVSGGVVAIDTLIAPAASIVQAFYPSMSSGAALATLLFGDANRFGRLPVTMYPGTYTAQVAMNNMSMEAGPGRTYRYYTGDALFPFGAGLSYTSFDVHCVNDTGDSGVQITCSVRNTGRDGDEVLLLFHAVGDDIRREVDHPVPLRALVDFQRVAVGAGDNATVSFSVGPQQLLITNAAGNRVLYPGSHNVCVRDGGVTDLWCTTVVVP
jgi:beta-glucosidase